LGAKSFVVGNLQEEIMMQKLGASNDDGDEPPMIASHQKRKKLQT